MQRYFKLLVSSIGAGLLIGIGGFVYVSTKANYPIIAAFLFAFGLFTIISLSLWLYTGKIGYVLENKANYLIDLAVCLVGNAIGAIGFGYLLRLASFEGNESLIRISSQLEVANSVSTLKLNSHWLAMLLLSFGCGILIYLAVEVSKRDLAPIIKVIAIFFAVALFILCGFEHCIANMFYFSLANAWNMHALLYLLLMILGNSLGSIVMYLIVKVSKL